MKLKRLLGGNYVGFKYVKDISIKSTKSINKSLSFKTNELYLYKQKMNMRKRRFLDIALNNNFDYFLTFTYDSKKYDNWSFENSLKKYFKRYIDKYILVPEWGEKNGRLHFHVLCNQLPKGLKLGINNYFKWGRADMKIIDKDNYDLAIMYLAKYSSKQVYDKNTYSKGLKRYVDMVVSNERYKLYVDTVQRENAIYKRYFIGSENVKEVLKGEF